MAGKVRPIPEGYRSVTPYLVVKGGAKAIDFYKKVFGAREKFRMEGQGGSIAHAEIEIGDSVVMLADENPQHGALSPASIGGTPVSIMLYVEDVDRVAEKLTAAGAKMRRPVQDMFYGDRSGASRTRSGTIGTSRPMSRTSRPRRSSGAWPR